MSFDIEEITKALAAAALDASRWSAAMEAVSVHTRSYGAALFPIRGRLPYVPPTKSLDESFELYLRDGWIHKDERYRATAKLISEGVVTDDDVATGEEIKRNPYYQEFLAPCNLMGFAGVKVGSGPNIWCLSIQRSSGQGNFTRPELQSLKRLSTNLDSIAETANALGFAQGAAALTSFEITGKAAVLLDRGGEVVRTNEAAERIFCSDIRVVRRRLISSSRNATDKLDQAIKRLIWTQETASVPSIALPRLGRTPVIAYAIRAQGLTDSPLSCFHVVVVLVDPDARFVPGAQTLHGIFGLTPAEARLAMALGSGSDLSGAASSLRLSLETVRKQLRVIFEKTSTRRQAELVAVLASLLPGR